MPALTNTMVSNRTLRTNVDRNILLNRDMYFLMIIPMMIERPRALVPTMALGEGSREIWTR